MGSMASQITGISIIYSAVCSGADKKTWKLCVIGLCDRWIPLAKASNVENISIRWRHIETNSGNIQTE